MRLPKYDGMPEPESPNTPTLTAVFHVMSYVWIATMDNGEVISGGGFDKLEEVRGDCDFVWDRSSPVCQSLYILDARGQIVVARVREAAAVG